ncbi:response regulator transcription factor [Bradyrhizobium sp. CCBAU 53338]|uniref:LuxR C-terminal-related transcriptional regulator n=1 Tax=Bradyrhizobium sp. CCBAU 53338 TaxID=1325111 RepID=UPI00188AB42F|nr:response regulator transcription factor [Bradyrhizobium sp. CCBAU 53338]QOZ54554.1 DNA-binding response regulator [Bradyrhizobium sp. CCBAU 53338]
MRRRTPFATVLVGQTSLLREGIARILREADFRVLTSVSSADEWIASNLQPEQVLFVVVHVGDDFGYAVEQIELFRSRHANCRIAIVTERYQQDDLVLAYNAGARGYFVDVTTCDVFIKSLELVMMGETIVPPASLSFALTSESQHRGVHAALVGHREADPVKCEDIIAPQLSPRETMILRCLIEGDSNKTIARKIDIAEATVKVHVKAILRKIRVQNRTQAAIWGINNELMARASRETSQPAGVNGGRYSPQALAELDASKPLIVDRKLG